LPAHCDHFTKTFADDAKMYGEMAQAHRQLAKDAKWPTEHGHGMRAVPIPIPSVPVTQPAGHCRRAMPPGCTFKYQFALRQSCTMMYHLHADETLQVGTTGPFATMIDLSGMLTIVKVPDELTRYEDGSRSHPTGTIATDATLDELRSDGIDS
jgi:hypothetical protein